MKFSNLLFFALGLFLFTSCGDDDKPADQVIGTWNIDSVEYSDCDDEINNDLEIYGDASCEDNGGEEECQNVTLSFTAPGTLVSVFTETVNGEVEESDTGNGTYSFSDTNENELTICQFGDCVTGIVSFSGSSMTLLGSDDGCVFTLRASK